MRAAAEIGELARALLAAGIEAIHGRSSPAAAVSPDTRAQIPPSREVAPPVAAAPAPAAAHTPSTPRASSQTELIDRVRADLRDAYDGHPVSPHRIAFRLKLDGDLVDAALTFLVRRREARMMRSRGKVAYQPVARSAK